MRRAWFRTALLSAVLALTLTAGALAAAGEMIVPPCLTLHWVTPFEWGNMSEVFVQNDRVPSYIYVSDGELVHTEEKRPELLELSPWFRSLRLNYLGPAWWFDETRPNVVEPEGGGFSLVAPDGTVLVPPGRYDGGGQTEGDGSAFGVYKRDETDAPKYGLLDVHGREVLPCVYDEITPLVLAGAPIRVGLLRADGQLRYGYAGWDGTLLTPVQYCELSDRYSFESGRVRVAVENDEGVVSYGYIDFLGREVIPCTYARAGTFCDGYAVVGQWDDNMEHLRYGILDTDGNAVLPVTYEAVDYAGQWTREETSPYGEYIWVRQDGKWGIFQLRNPTKPIAYPTEYRVLVDGVPVVLDTYAVKDENGYDTNFAKLRDVAHLLNGTPAQFNVFWEPGATTTATTGAPYTTPNGQEMSAPFNGPQAFLPQSTFDFLRVDGVPYEAAALNLTDPTGGGYTYFRLRDLGKMLGFSVTWDAAEGAVRLDTGEASKTPSF